MGLGDGFREFLDLEETWRMETSCMDPAPGTIWASRTLGAPSPSLIQWGDLVEPLGSAVLDMPKAKAVYSIIP
jgi:hypothetical protein